MPKKKEVNIILDTNLFISFLIGKRVTKLKDNLINTRARLIFSEQNIEELKLVTKRPKFEKYFNQRDVSDLIDFIYTIGTVISISPAEEPAICRDPKDDFLLALSEKGKADYLITGDNDLLILGNYKKTKIITIEHLEKILD